MQLNLITPPIATAIPVAALRKQLEIGDDPSHDDHLLRLIKSATLEIERLTRRSVMRKMYRAEFNRPYEYIGSSIELPRPPLIAIEAVRFRGVNDSDWTESSNSFKVDPIAVPTKIVLLKDHRYMRVDYWTGHESPDQVPEDLRDAITQLAAFKFENRGDIQGGLPISLKGLIDSLRLGTVTGYY